MNKINQAILEFTKSFDNVIWDWNGTLIDDVDIAVNCINKLLPKYNAPTITAGKYREIFDFPIRKYYEYLGLDLKDNLFEEIRDQYIVYYNSSIALSSSLFPETIELLEEIKKTKKQFILSAVSQWHLDYVTAHFKIAPFFNGCFGVSDHYAVGKLDKGLELIKQTSIVPQKTILIGDTIHDFEVATKLGFHCLLLADGHQSEARLKKHTPHVLSGRRTFI